MSIQQFDHILMKIKRFIKKSDRYRVPISPDFRLLVTLRHLATGDSFETLSMEYLIGLSTVPHIIYEVCDVIWSVFHETYIRWPSDMIPTAKEFAKRYNFPHCCGAIDGKHVRIQKPPHSSSLYWNYKGYFSIVLLGVCDADCNFIYADIGAYGSQSDQSVFQYSTLGRAMSKNMIKWPSEQNLPNSNVPFGYFIVGDEAFPLSQHLLRPYPRNNLDAGKQHFNKKLSASRATIERSFGILVTRFRIFKREINALPKNVEKIVKACITLHNFIQKTQDEETPIYHPPPRDNDRNTRQRRSIGRPTLAGEQNRKIYKDYLLRSNRV